MWTLDLWYDTLPNIFLSPIFDNDLKSEWHLIDQLKYHGDSVSYSRANISAARTLRHDCGSYYRLYCNMITIYSLLFAITEK